MTPEEWRLAAHAGVALLLAGLGLWAAWGLAREPREVTYATDDQEDR